MAISSIDFLADAAAVYLDRAPIAGFGSGRLIAPGLVLTAAHVIVDGPDEWNVCLLRDRSADGSWAIPAYKARVVWSGLPNCDAAVLQLTSDTPPRPRLNPVFSSHDSISELYAIAAGFPEAWRNDGSIREYTVTGSLRNVDAYGPYAWRVAFGDKPDVAKGWQGMSGASVCHVGTDDKLFLLGILQQVPANFRGGLLEATRISKALEHSKLRHELQRADVTVPEVSYIDQDDRIELSFDRDATKSYYYTFDGDNNRNINRHLTRRLWSFSIFSLAPTIFVSYKLKIHGADVLAYNRHSEEWLALETNVQVGFPGQSVRREVLKFQDTHAPFAGSSLEPGESQKILIPKIGVFADAISHEFTERPHRWDSPEQTSYVCVAVILHIHTRHLFFVCLLPDLTASSNPPTYFIGAPQVFDTNDRKAFERLAGHYLKNVGSLGVSERAIIPGVIT